MKSEPSEQTLVDQVAKGNPGPGLSCSAWCQRPNRLILSIQVLQGRARGNLCKSSRGEVKVTPSYLVMPELAPLPDLRYRL
jgi:hypothetical protein